MTEAQIDAPTLQAFKKCDAYIRCIKGPVGSGKSSQCVKEILRRAARQDPGPDGVRRSRWAVIRNTYRELQDTTRKTFEEWIGVAGNWREKDFTFVGECDPWGAGHTEFEVLFRSLDRPEDIRKLLSLELTGAYINEAREISRQVFEVLDTRVGRYPSMTTGGPTWAGIWMDTNPWHTGHWLAKWFRALPETPQELLARLGLTHHSQYGVVFQQPGGRSAEAENKDNLQPGYYDRLCIGRDDEWIQIYVDGQDADAAPGAVYGKLIERFRRKGGICRFEHPNDGVFTSWDLGYSDSTAIWFWRINEHRSVDVIDHYEAHGHGISHYVDVLATKGYSYIQHWLPHDTVAKTMVTSSSFMEQAFKHWPGKVKITPGLSVEDGIAAGRWLLEQPIRIHARCGEAVETLGAYRYEWDEENLTYGRKPVHDFSSHTADAWRYLACVVKYSELITRPKAAPVPPIIPPVDKAWDLNRLFKDHEKGFSKRRRV